MTEISLSQFQTAVGMQTDARRTMRENNTPQKLLGMLQEELDELIQGVGEYHQETENQDDSNIQKELLVGSEIADILYLCLSLADKMGIDASISLERKMKRNLFKYPFEMFNDSIPYSEAHVMCKELWQQEGGDKSFYEKELGVQLTDK